MQNLHLLWQFLTVGQTARYMKLSARRSPCAVKTSRAKGYMEISKKIALQICDYVETEVSDQ